MLQGMCSAVLVNGFTSFSRTVSNVLPVRLSVYCDLSSYTIHLWIFSWIIRLSPLIRSVEKSHSNKILRSCIFRFFFVGSYFIRLFVSMVFCKAHPTSSKEGLFCLSLFLGIEIGEIIRRDRTFSDHLQCSFWLAYISWCMGVYGAVCRIVDQWLELSRKCPRLSQFHLTYRAPLF